MAVKSSSKKSAEQVSALKASQSARKAVRIKKDEKRHHENLNEILAEVNRMISTNSTEDIRTKVCSKFNVSKSFVTNIIKRARKNSGIYNRGDLPRTIKWYNEELTSNVITQYIDSHKNRKNILNALDKDYDFYFKVQNKRRKNK